MEYVLIATSLFLLALAFILTENNAKYLLAGYNTMSPEERKKVDIKGLIAYFKKFFIFLGLSFLVVGLAVNHYFSENIVALILCLYPIIAVVYFVVKSQKFYKKD